MLGCRHMIGGVAMLLAAGATGANANAQEPSAVPANCLPKSWLDPGPTYSSVEALADGRITFRLCAPLAKDAKVVAGDIPNFPGGMKDGVAEGLPMTRDATGLWSVTTPMSVPADTYRFTFQVDGAPVSDPRGT